MKQFVTTGIILSRTEYGEADRIITVLTPDHGKLRLMAKGVRRLKSKMAGGIDLFTVSDLTFMPGKGEIGTLISSRMQRHYGGIVRDIDRVQMGYELIKLLNKTTADQPESDYFELLQQSFAALENHNIDLGLIHMWFYARLLHLAGHSPNLETDTSGQKLDPLERYSFDYEYVAFSPQAKGIFRASHIKFLRLLFGEHQPVALMRIEGRAAVQKPLGSLIETMAKTYIM